MPKAIKPQRGLFLCLALGIGILGCQPTGNQIDPGGIDPSTGTTVRKTPKPTVTYTPDPGTSPDPGATPSPSPSPTQNPHGIRGVLFGQDNLSQAEGGGIPGAPTYNYCLYIKPPLQADWPDFLTYQQAGDLNRQFYPTVVKQAFFARVEMDNNDSPGDLEMRLTLPNGKSATMSVNADYRLGQAPFDDLSFCESLRDITIKTVASTESIVVGQTWTNGMRFLINTVEATSSSPVSEVLRFTATSLKAKTLGAADVQPVTRSITVTNSGDIGLEIN